MHFGKFIRKALLAIVLTQYFLSYLLRSPIVILLLLLTIITLYWGPNLYWLLFYISVLILLWLRESYLTLSNVWSRSSLLLHNKIPPNLVTNRTNMSYVTVSVCQESEHSLAESPVSAVSQACDLIWRLNWGKIHVQVHSCGCWKDSFFSWAVGMCVSVPPWLLAATWESVGQPRGVRWDGHPRWKPLCFYKWISEVLVGSAHSQGERFHKSDYQEAGSWVPS